MIVLYGAGQEFVKIIKENKIKRFELVIDTYFQNYPQGVCGYTVYDKSKLSNLTDKDFVCITSLKYFDDIFRIIKEINSVVNIINLHQLVWMEYTLPKLLKELKNKVEIYEIVDDNRIRQWLNETDNDEVTYWKKRIPEVKRAGDQRFTQREFVYQYNSELTIKDDDLILDVGSGPLPKFGNMINGHIINYIPLDPLAYSYIKILGDLGINLPVYPDFALMEILTCFYQIESVDYVIVNNALDHSIDILRAFIECLAVVRLGGYLLLEHMEAEGAHNGYTGLHTWNITSIENDLIFFDEINKVNISKMFSMCCEIETKRIKQGYRDMIIAKIYKKESVPKNIMQQFNVKEFAGKIIRYIFEKE